MYLTIHIQKNSLQNCRDITNLSLQEFPNMLKLRVVLVNFKKVYLHYSTMSSSGNAASEEDYLRKLVSFAIENESFRNELTLNPKEAISSRNNELGFSYNQLSDESREVVSSFTAEELDTLRRIYIRAKNVDIDLDPLKML